MSVIKKSSFPLHLDVYNVFINDTDPNSRYFKVTQLNDVFTGGKNGFLIQGAPELKEGSYIFLEIKDSAGAIIYTEIAGGKPGEYYEGLSKPVSAHVYEDTAFGAAVITIVGELKEWDDNGIIRPIPDEWIGKINVKWQKTITVNPFIANVSTVRLYKRPEITITEKLLPIYSVANSRIILTGSLKATAIDPVDNTNYPYYGPITYQLESINPQSASIKAFSPAYPYPIENIAPTPFRSELINGPISITDIYGFYDSNLKFTAVSGSPYNFTTTIQDLTSQFRANATFPYVTTNSKIKDIALAKWSTSYISSSTIQSNLSSSYAEVKIKNLDTFTGDVYRIKVFSKSRNDLKGYSLLEDIVIEAVELLEVNELNGIINRKLGVFDGSEILGFWETKNLESSPSVIPLGLKPSSEFIGSPIVVLSPQNDIDNINGLFAFNFKNSLPFQDTEYTLAFKTALSGSENAGILEVYMSGSAFVNTNNDLKYGKKLKTLQGLGIQTFEPQSINFKPDYIGSGSVSFVVRGGTWELADVSIKPSKQSAFTPGELSFLTKPNVQVPSESFDFRFELFDINYNYVPVKLEKTILFGGGNDILPSLTVTLSNNVFVVNADASAATPSTITINVARNVITDDVRFLSSSLQPGGLGLTNGYKGPIIAGRNYNNIIAPAVEEIDNNFPITSIGPADLNNQNSYPGGLTEMIKNEQYELSFESFKNSLKNNQRTEYITYTAIAGGKLVQFTIGADYAAYTTTTTTTTTSTSTTSTTSTSTTSTSTTAIPGSTISISVTNKANLNGGNPVIEMVQYKLSSAGDGAYVNLSTSPVVTVSSPIYAQASSNSGRKSVTAPLPVQTYDIRIICNTGRPNNLTVSFEPGYGSVTNTLSSVVEYRNISDNSIITDIGRSGALTPPYNRVYAIIKNVNATVGISWGGTVIGGGGID